MKRLTSLIILSVCMSFCSLSLALSDTEQKIISYVDAEMPLALALLEKTVNINSGTMNHDGVKQVGQCFMEEFNQLGFQTTWITLPPELNRAGHLFAEKKGTSGKRILLIGHLDTVFEPGSPSQHAKFYADHATGPGILDMKSGDVALVFALRALQAAGVLSHARIIVALIGDEESAGRPTSISRSALVDAAKKSDVALEFEFGGQDLRQAVIARRGVSRWQLEVTAESAHSSKIFQDQIGRGAIFSAAHILENFYQELHSEPNLSFNPGIILGGTNVHYLSQQSQGSAFGKENIIANTAITQGDMRFISQQQEADARRRMTKIAQDIDPTTQAQITFIDGYPAMPPTNGNRLLLEQLSRVNEELGNGPVTAFPIQDRGASDVSFVANYIDALGGLGAAGAGAHTEQEYIDLKSFPEIIKRTAILIYRLSQQDD